MDLEDFKGETSINDLPTGLLKQIQEILANIIDPLDGKPFYQGEVDGIVGIYTRKAFSDYKSSRYLSDLLTLGETTASSLVEDIIGHKVTEQETDNSKSVLIDAGSKTGKKMILPTGETVYQNQFIIPNGNLTYGELTKNCTRLFTQISHCQNAIELAKVFAVVRDKFGKPIVITSGYRPEPINTQVGGVANSRHTKCEALDMTPLDFSRMELDRLFHIVLQEFNGVGDGRHRNFAHGDIRPYQVRFGY